MWVSKRYQRTIIQAHSRWRKHKQTNNNRKIMKPKAKTELSNNLWNVLPQGLWLKSEYFNIDQKRDVSSVGNIFQSFQNKVKGALERQELLKSQQNKLDTAIEMTEYVSQMMKDYFTSDNLQKVIAKTKVSLCRMLSH